MENPCFYAVIWIAAKSETIRMDLAHVVFNTYEEAKWYVEHQPYDAWVKAEIVTVRGYQVDGQTCK